MEYGAARSIAAQRIQTQRLTLVPLAPAHAEALAPALADPQLHAFIGGEPLDADALRAQIERWAAGSPDESQCWLNWTIQLNSDGALVGTMQATVYDADGGPSADIAWVVGTGWQGQGIASEAARGLLSWLLSVGVRSVSALIHPAHEASQRVAVAAGLVPTEHVVDGEIRWELASGPTNS
jgi:RimJ/RimL family protein N-acetyltransferase